MTVLCGNVTVVAVGSISISSTPIGATVWLAPNVGGSPGSYVNQGVVTSITNVAIGDYFIKLVLAGYSDYVTASFSVLASTNTPITATFAGSLYITSILTGASVYIDGSGSASGTTPLTVTNFSPGTHYYILKYTGYADTSSTAFNITAGTTTTVSNVSFLGSASFTSSPTGAEIWIDGADKGLATPNTITGLTAGSRGYTLKKTGYADTTGILTAANDTTVVVSLVTFAGSLYITSVLTGASVYIDGSGSASGTTPLTVTNFSPGTHYYILKYTGYADTSSTAFNITAGTTTTVSNVSFLGSASFTSLPSVARIWIDGSDTGVDTPGTAKGLTAGSRGYTLKKTGYADTTGILTAANDTTVVVSLVTFAGSLYITSVLTGASVYIDGSGSASGTTPLTVTNFSPGTHYYILKYTGYTDTASTAFSITAGQTTTVSNVSFLGSASFTSSPTGARIWIDSSDTGVDTNGTVKGLTAGSRGYTLVKTNYANVTGILTAVNDSTVAVSLITMSALGNISVSSTPSGASVYLDGSGTSLGTTPLVITGVLTGSHDVKLTLATYQDYTATGVSVTIGDTAIVSHTMVLSTGSVLFTSTPAGARIWLGPYLGTKIDQGVNTPNTIAILVPGLYDYSLVLSNYLTLTGTITISAATQTNETVTFAGSAYITSSPTGAEIYLAQSPGTPVDQFFVTPTTFTGATDPSSEATKTWNYKLTKAGYTDRTGSFLATAGQTATVTETMATVADIRAQSMTITPSSPCIEGSCSVSVSITWINNGESSGMFTPNILIDGGATSFSTPYGSQPLAGGGATVTKIFTITGLTAAGSPHGICPNPN